jgi:two-component system response regulator AtoC
MCTKEQNSITPEPVPQVHAGYDTTVLITGESGTGKELVARGIHNHSKRKDGPLITVNCGSIPANLLESEFFGYMKGAFTGADKNHTGLFEAAEGGTLFLDEIGELSLELQVKLLRVLQEHEIRAVGAIKPRKVDVRVITATAKDLDQEVVSGNFRQDLFFRLNVMVLELPPLRERREDIPFLCSHFLDCLNKKMELKINSISAEAMSLLMAQGWSGNVRELENSLERAMIFAEGNRIEAENLPQFFESPKQNRRIDDLLGTSSLKKAQKILEKRLIGRSLETTNGNKSRAARMLEISYPSLLAKIKEYGL